VLEVVYVSLLIGAFFLVSALGGLTVYRLFKGQD
jgi:hypothetical protein